MPYRPVLSLLLVLTILAAVSLPASNGQGTDISALYVSPTTSHWGMSGAVQVELNLSSSESFNAYDIQMSYNSSVLQVQSLASAPGTTEVANCVDGVGKGCNTYDTSGVLHSAALFPNVLQGPYPQLLLFTAQFRVIGIGLSLFHPYNVILANPDPAPHPILHLTDDGVYSNQGITAFFNVFPAIQVVNQPITFDASQSFNPNGAGIASYSWSFGDGTNGIGSITSHNYTSPRDYTVTLSVSNGTATGRISKVVSVSPDLGGILIDIRKVGGDALTGRVTASLYNGTIFVENSTKPAATMGAVSFYNLTQRSYRVNFSGPGVVPSYLMEPVVPGWTTYDTAFLTVTTLPPASNSYFAYVILVAAVGGGVALGSVAVVRRRFAWKRTQQSLQRPSSGSRVRFWSLDNLHESNLTGWKHWVVVTR